MELEFHDARAWSYIVSAISKIIEEGVFIVNPDEGIRFRAMDPSHVILLDLYIPRDSFEKFEVDEETRIGVNFEELAKILRRAKKDDKLALGLEDSSFAITFRGVVERTFTLPIIEIAAEEIPEPQLEFKASVKMLSSVYQEALKDIEFVGDIIKFIASSSEFKMVSSSELGEAEVVYTRESGSLVDLEAEEVQQASYTLEYFIDLSSAARIADTITIRFSTDMPAEVVHELPQGMVFKFLVAPRVE